MSAQVSPASPARPAMTLLIVLGMISILVTVVFARLAYGLVLPAMRADLGLSYAQAANLGTVTALGYISMLLYAGVFAGRHGGRRAILLGLAFAFCGFSGMALSSHYGLQMVFMAALGFGTAFTFTPLISLLGAWYPDRRGTVIGFANSGVGIGMLVSGALVPALTEQNPVDGLRHVWMVFAISAAATGMLLALLLRNPPRLAQAGGGAETGLAGRLSQPARADYRPDLWCRRTDLHCADSVYVQFCTGCTGAADYGRTPGGYDGTDFRFFRTGMGCCGR